MNSLIIGNQRPRGDVRALHLSGVIGKTPEGGTILPYDVIRLDFTFDTRIAA